MIKALKDGNQRDALMAWGRMVTGSALWTLGYAAVRMGLARGPIEDPKERQVALSGFRPNAFNLTGAGRALRGEDPAWQPGDRLVDFRNLGLPGAVMSMVSSGADRQLQLAHDMGIPVDPDNVPFWKTLFSGLPHFPKFMLEMSSMRGALDLLETIQKSDDPNAVSRWASNYWKVYTGMVLPATLRDVLSAQWDYMPDPQTGRQSFDETAITLSIRQAANHMKMRLPGGAASLPPRRDLYGRPVAGTPEGANPVVYHLFDPLRSQTIPDDAVVRELDRLVRATNASEHLPSRPARTLELLGRKFVLSDRLYDRLKELIGAYRLNATQNLMRAPSWERLPDAAKVGILKSINEESAGIARLKAAFEFGLLK
jgi:hypothetical protein